MAAAAGYTRRVQKTLLNTNGRGSMWMEGWKFAVYLAIPIAASAYYNNPDRMKKAAEYWQFVQYPANPVTGLREQIIKAHEQSSSREEYRKQLENLNQTASETTKSSHNKESSRGIWEWLFGKSGAKE